MMEANEEQLRQRHERKEAETAEETRLIQIMLDKFKVKDPRNACNKAICGVHVRCFNHDPLSGLGFL